jgi:hypothetical protein
MACIAPACLRVDLQLFKNLKRARPAPHVIFKETREKAVAFFDGGGLLETGFIFFRRPCC